MGTVQSNDVGMPIMSVMRAAREGRLDEMQRHSRDEILRAAAADTQTPLLAACRNGHSSVVDWLVGVAGVDVEQVRLASLNRFYFVLFSKTK